MPLRVLTRPTTTVDSANLDSALLFPTGWPENLSGHELARAMSKVSQQQEVAVLSKSKNGLVFLTPNDWALVADKATRRHFKTGDKIVEQGKRTFGLYLLLNGTASVLIPPPRNIGPGEVCGEISFLDDFAATTTVVANEPVEAYFIDRPTLQSLFELFPHLGSRFYQSMAGILSRRLREVIGAPIPAKPAAAKKQAT